MGTTEKRDYSYVLVASYGPYDENMNAKTTMQAIGNTMDAIANGLESGFVITNSNTFDPRVRCLAP